MKRNKNNQFKAKCGNEKTKSLFVVGVFSLCAVLFCSSYAQASGPRHNTTTTSVTVASRLWHRAPNSRLQHRDALLNRINIAANDKARAEAELGRFGITSSLSRRANNEERRARTEIRRGNLYRAETRVDQLEQLTRRLVVLARDERRVRQEFKAARAAANWDLANAQRVVGRWAHPAERNLLNRAERELTKAQDNANRGRFAQAVSHLEKSRQYSGEAIFMARRSPSTNSRFAQRGRR